MNDFLLWGLGVLIFLTIVAVSIGLHEAGHMIVARKLGLKVPRFFIGFGPTLFSKKFKNAEYGIKALPIGGFVEIFPPDKDAPDDSNKTKNEKDFETNMLSHVSPWKRILVFFAGPAVNLVLGVLILTMTFWTTPFKTATQEIDSVAQCSETVACGAQTSGIQKGDYITKINGKTVTSTNDISDEVKGSSVDLTVKRNSGEKTITVPIHDGKIGINYVVNEHSRSLPESVGLVGTLIWSNVEAIAELPSRVGQTVEVLFGADRTDESLASIVTVGRLYGHVSASDEITDHDKLVQYSYYAGAINLGIGFINLLPLLPLDGGRIAIAIVDSVRRNFMKLFGKIYTPTSAKFAMAFASVSVVIVFATMGLVILTDIVSPVDFG